MQFLYEGLYYYHKEQGLQSIIKSPLPETFHIDSSISFEDFCLEMGRCQNIPFPSKVVPNDTLHDRMMRAITNRMRNKENDGWLFVDACRFQGKSNDNSHLTQKMYLSVDNKNLHQFSALFLEKCTDLGIEYDFKINNNSDYRRADNVVIYTSNNNFLKYVSVIKEIKSNNSYIDFGPANLLSYPYEEYIGVAPIEKDDASYSYSETLCKEICRLRGEEEISFDHFFENVKFIMGGYLRDTIHFCEESRMLEDVVNNEISTKIINRGNSKG